MISNFSLMLMSFIFLLILLIYFLSKEHVNTKELVLYKGLLISNLIGLFMEMLCSVSIKFFDKGSILTLVINKVYLLYFIVFLTLLSVYTYLIAEGLEKYNKHYPHIKRICTMVIISAIILVAVLPINFNYGDVAYSYGPAVDTVYAYSFAGVILCIVLMLKNIKKIKSQKYLPLITYIVGSGFVAIVQKINPELTLSTTMDAIVLFIMYFTIENPDIKMLNEVYKNKELMEQGYEDKYNFLFEMTQEAKRPILDLNRVTGELRLEDNPNKIKEGVAVINNLTRQLDFAINNVLNISSFDIQKLKIIDTKYDVLKVCDGLETTLRNEIKQGVTFNMELPKTVPILYGDYMKLRQILYSLLNNASKNTENGSVNLKLNIIEKYDFCRLIFNISDTGKGMSIEKINDILSSTGELNKEEMEYLEKKEFNFKVCQKVVKIMGGNLMIKSTIGKGTEITLTLDQRVYHEKDNSILNQYENDINTSKRVLIVSQNKDLAGYIKKKLNNNDITYSALAYGGDAVDRIKAGKSYDYMLIEDDMKEMSGLATLQELQKLKNFNIPVIIMLNKDKDSIKEHYIEDGFTDYLLTDNLEEEIKRIIDKY